MYNFFRDLNLGYSQDLVRLVFLKTIPWQHIKTNEKLSEFYKTIFKTLFLKAFLIISFVFNELFNHDYFLIFCKSIFHFIHLYHLDSLLLCNLKIFNLYFLIVTHFLNFLVFGFNYLSNFSNLKLYILCSFKLFQFI